MSNGLTYAQVAEKLSKREGKYESLYTEAVAKGDRFQRNSAELMLDRVRRVRDELFAEQEAQKTPEMAMGGKVKYNWGGPIRTATSPVELPMEDGDNPPVFTAFPAYQNPGLTPWATGRLDVSPMPALNTRAGIVPKAKEIFPTQYATPRMSATSSGVTGGAAGKLPKLGSVEMAAIGSLGTLFSAARAANNMIGPTRPRPVSPPRYNTSVNVSDQLNDIDQGTMALERSLTRSGMPGANSMALARRTAADRLKAGVFASKRAQEQQLENQQATATYQTDAFNNTLANQFQEASRQFSNDKIAFRQRATAEAVTGLQGAMRDKSMMELDKEKALIMRSGYSDAVTAETIASDVNLGRSAEDISAKYSPTQIASFARLAKSINPALYEKLLAMFPTIVN